MESRWALSWASQQGNSQIDNDTKLLCTAAICITVAFSVMFISLSYAGATPFSIPARMDKEDMTWVQLQLEEMQVEWGLRQNPERK